MAEMKKQSGILTIVSGFAGSGKGSIITRLMEKYDDYALSISATTREKRPAELEGVHYFFISREEFEKKIRNDEFYEYNEYNGNYYGSLRSYVDKLLSQGKDVILEIDVNGAMNIKKNFPDTVLVFVSAPSAIELERRLRDRGTETVVSMQNRLKTAAVEATHIKDYDYLIINENYQVKNAADTLHCIIQSEKHKTTHNIESIKRISEEVISLTR